MRLLSPCASSRCQWHIMPLPGHRGFRGLGRTAHSHPLRGYSRAPFWKALFKLTCFEKAGGSQNLPRHSEDSRQHPLAAGDSRATEPRIASNPRFSELRPIGTPFPDSTEIGKRRFPVSRFRPNRKTSRSPHVSESRPNQLGIRSDTCWPCH
jgi:hypothetical protein